MPDWPVQPQSMSSPITSTEILLLAAGVVLTLGVIVFVLFSLLRRKE